MPTFRVYGADKESGNEAAEMVDAPDAHEAEAIANHRGLLVERVEAAESSATAPTIAKASKKSLALPIALVAGAAILVFVLAFAPTIMSRVSAAQDSSDEEAAWVEVQERVKRDLKAPATAEFPAVDTTYPRGSPDVGYTFSSHVDAKNPMGVMLRQRFEATVVPAGDGWIVTKVEWLD